MSWWGPPTEGIGDDPFAGAFSIGAKVTRHSKYVTFQLAEVAVTWRLISAILSRIARLAIPPSVFDPMRL